MSDQPTNITINFDSTGNDKVLYILQQIQDIQDQITKSAEQSKAAVVTKAETSALERKAAIATKALKINLDNLASIAKSADWEQKRTAILQRNAELESKIAQVRARHKIDEEFANTGKIDEAVAAFNRRNQQILASQKLAAATTAEFKAWDKALLDLDRKNHIAKLGTQLATATTDGRQLESAMVDVRRQLEAIGATEGEVRRVMEAASKAARSRNISDDFDDISRRVALAGDFQSNLGAMRGLSGLAGLGGLATGLDAAGEIVVLAEELPRLKAAMSGLPETIKNAVSAIGPAGLAFTGAAAAAALAIKLLTDQYNAQYQRTSALVDLLRQQTQRQIENASLIRDASTETIDSQITVLMETIKATEDELNELRSRENAAREEMARMAPWAALVIGIEEFSAAQAEADRYNAAIQESSKAYITASEQLHNLVNVVGPAVAAREEEEAAMERQREVMQSLIDTQTNRMALDAQVRDASKQDVKQLEERIQALRDEHAALRAAADALSGVEDETGTLLPQLIAWQIEMNNIAELERELTNVAIPLAMAREAEAEAMKKQEEAQRNIETIAQRTVQIEEQTVERRAAIIEQGSKQIQAAEERLAKARVALQDFDTQLLDKRRDLDDKYMSEELDRARKFNRDQERLKQDSNRRMLELSQRLEDQLFAAELSNNVAQFIQAQQEFKRASEKETSNLDTTSQRRVEDFNAEIEKAQQVRNERIAALEKEAQTNRANLEARIQEEAAALEQTKQDIRDKYDAEQKAMQDTLRKLVLEYDKSSQRMANTMQQAFSIMEQAGISTVNGIIGEMRRQAAMSVSVAALANVAASSSGIGGVIRGGRTITAFADGALSVSKPTLGIIGERPGYSEALIPYKKSEGIESELARLGLGSTSVNISVSGPIVAHEGITRSQFVQAMDTMAQDISQALQGARIGRRPA